jgi:type III pantothenate kinase
MNLTIDQGNSFTKIALFDNENYIENFIFDSFGEKELLDLFAKYPIQNSILSSVIHTSPTLLAALKAESKIFIELTDKTPIPIKNSYASPETLGKDRIAVAVAANFLQPNANCLVIDAGTTITYELITSKGEYLGGNISPGMNIRFKSLNTFTKKLPLIESAENFELIGNSTQTAILSGVMNGIIFEMDGYINTLKEKYPDLSTFLTGGDTFFFDTKLKNRIFAVKNLLVIGLNRILNYNV